MKFVVEFVIAVIRFLCTLLSSSHFLFPIRNPFKLFHLPLNKVIKIHNECDCFFFLCSLLMLVYLYALIISKC